MHASRLLLVVFAFGALTEASFVSSSSISSCILDGSSTVEEAQLNCQQKMVVALSVTNEQGPTETIEASVETATDADGEVRRLAYPISFTMSKSEAYIIYPISYVQTTNAAPYEETIYTNIVGCDDGDTSQDPTCGWFVQNNGNVVRHSQGYCCSCSLMQLLGISDSSSRAGLSCSLFGPDSSSAHCLRFGELWYDAFDIGTAFISYTITVTMTTFRDDAMGGKAEVSETVALGPDTPLAASLDGTLISKLIGDFAPFEQFPVLSEKLLMVPSQPLSHPRVQAGTANWMFIDAVDAELDGLVCNKIGVSFEAFRNEFGACGNQGGSCLRNQLEDFHQRDEQKRNSGLIGDYFIGNYGNFLVLQGSGESSSNDRVLGLLVEQIQNSLITLTFSADNIRFITNRSPGRITNAFVVEFEALSKNGFMNVVIENTGSIPADYTTTVTECSEGIQAVPARVSSIPSGASEALVFDVRSQTALSLEYECTVTLFDAVGHLEDRVVVPFSTEAQSVSYGAQGYDEEPDVQGRGNGTAGLPLAVLGCTDYCPQFYDIMCFFLTGCWAELAKLFALVVIVLLIIAGCCYCCVSGLGIKALLCCYQVTKTTTSLQSSFLDNRLKASKEKERRRRARREQEEYAVRVQEEVEELARRQAQIKSPLPMPGQRLPPRDR